MCYLVTLLTKTNYMKISNPAKKSVELGGLQNAKGN